MKKIYLLILVLVLGITGIFFMEFLKKTKETSEITDTFSDNAEEKEVVYGEKIEDRGFTVYKPDLNKEIIKMYWKDENNKAYSELSKFIQENTGDKINFATNGGIYSEEYEPNGLYIENHKIISKINLADGEGNFYMQPNGVFYIQNNQPKISESKAFEYNENISYATQSGPLLIENGVINKKIGKNSESFKIRSAVGIDRENKVFFLMSSEKINFYDFSKYALDKLNCKDLLFWTELSLKCILQMKRKYLNRIIHLQLLLLPRKGISSCNIKRFFLYKEIQHF